jgi:hypothetical protein
VAGAVTGSVRVEELGTFFPPKKLGTLGSVVIVIVLM